MVKNKTMKISLLGAGSVGFTQTRVRDILKVKKLQNIEISLHDISRSKLLMVAEVIQKDIKANNLPTKPFTVQDNIIISLLIAVRSLKLQWG